MDLSGNNVFLYWVGKEYRLIQLLRKLIYLHANSGKGYTVHLITRENVETYLEDLPACFDSLMPAHQADYVRVNVVCKYGGIWLDSDTIVLESLDPLFKFLHEKDGFFLSNRNLLCNGVFGSKPNTAIMNMWKQSIDEILDVKRDKIEYVEIGNRILDTLRKTDKSLYFNYTILSDKDTLMPIHYSVAADILLDAPYESHIEYEREFQPALVLFNWVYRRVENDPEYRSRKNILNYFIDKSIKNLGGYAEGI